MGGPLLPHLSSFSEGDPVKLDTRSATLWRPNWDGPSVFFRNLIQKSSPKANDFFPPKFSSFPSFLLFTQTKGSLLYTAWLLALRPPSLPWVFGGRFWKCAAHPTSWHPQSACPSHGLTWPARSTTSWHVQRLRVDLGNRVTVDRTEGQRRGWTQSRGLVAGPEDLPLPHPR